MGLLTRLFSRHEADPEILPAIERAVTRVDVNLVMVGGYPEKYRKPVESGLEYARHLASILPGPVTLDRKSFATDPLVHAIFPDPDSIGETFRESHSMIGFRRENPESTEVFALMGMRRMEKRRMGYELSGDLLKRDSMQKVIYFTSHTIENPAGSEEHSRDLIGLSFFDSLVASVAKRMNRRREEMSLLSSEKDLLASSLHGADPAERERIGKELERIVREMQQCAQSLDLRQAVTDFEEVLLHPEKYLGLDRTELSLDGMGIRQDESGNAIVFSDLFGYDRRRWTVTMVHCSQIGPGSAEPGAFPRKMTI